MSAPTPLLMGALVLGILTNGCRGPSPPVSRSAPNFVLVVADDLRHDGLGFSGHPFVKTPRIDRIAAEGARFTNAFAVTPVCCPSRASILTGAYPHLTGASSNRSDIDYSRYQLVTDPLRSQGYTVAAMGKWHLGGNVPPEDRFDHCVALGRPRGGVQPPEHTTFIGGREVRESGRQEELITQHAVEFIRKQASRPFFLLVGLKSPHLPFNVAPRHRYLFDGVDIRLPESSSDPSEKLPRSIRGSSPRTLARRELSRLASRGHPIREFHREYARMIPAIDESVGAIDDALAAAGIRERTAIIITSDNGYLIGEHGLVQKELAYEPSIRLPLVIRYPREIAPGSSIHQLVLNVDLAPTILSWAGITPPAQMQGRDMSKLIRGTNLSWRDRALFVGGFEPGARPRYLALRTSNEKYVRHVSGVLEEELFDLRRDSGERENLASDPRWAPVLASMRRSLAAAMVESRVPEEWIEPALGAAEPR